MKKKLFLVLAISIMLVCFFALGVSATEADPNADYYDRVYTAIDGTELPLYESETVDGITTYYPLVWFSYDLTEEQDNGDGTTSTVVVDTVYVRVRYDNANPTTRNYSQGRFNAVSYTYTDDEGVEHELTNENVVLLNLRDTYVYSGTSKTIVKNFEANASDPSFSRMEAIYFPLTITSISRRSGGWSKLKVFDLTEQHIETITVGGTQLFNGNTSIETLYFPKSIDFGNTNSICKGATNLKTVTFEEGYSGLIPSRMFEGCTKLEFVELGGTSLTSIGSLAFNGCSSLQAISINSCPAIAYSAFASCTSLKAVYLPDDLTRLGSSGNNNYSQGAFCDAKNVYFVHSPFSVTDENGNFYTTETFVQPSKPDVYYMPSTLAEIYGTTFRTCKNINPVVVFPTTLTSVTCWEGAFSISGTEESPKLYVFLGDMEKFCFSGRDGRYNNVSFLFANSNDTGIESMTFQLGYKAAPTNSYAYFCTGKTYDLNSFTASSETYVVSEGEFDVTEETIHKYSPRLDKYSDATCTAPAGDYTYCFCGKEMTFVAVEGSKALGHLYNDLRGRYYPETDGVPNYYGDAMHQYYCSQCKETIEETREGTSLFTRKGYSVNESDPTNVSYIVYANTNLIAEIMGEGFEYGLVVSANPDGNPLEYVDGELVADEYALKIEMSGNSYNKLTVKVSNVTAETLLHCNGYVADGESVVYLNHKAVEKTATSITHTDMVKLQNEDQTTTTPTEGEENTEEVA